MCVARLLSAPGCGRLLRSLRGALANCRVSRKSPCPEANMRAPQRPCCEHVLQARPGRIAISKDRSARIWRSSSAAEVFDADPNTQLLAIPLVMPGFVPGIRGFTFSAEPGRHLAARKATRSRIRGILIPVMSLSRVKRTPRFQTLTYCAWGCFRDFSSGAPSEGRAATRVSRPPSPRRVPHSGPKTDSRPKTSPPASDSRARRRRRNRRPRRRRKVPG
jgi:hypothetical protein